jgi:predicted ribosomally synthesized peptide with nif11-like leader
MSAEHAMLFIEKMKTDKALQNEIFDIKTPHERIKAIREKGFDVSNEEIEEILLKLIEDVISLYPCETLNAQIPKFNLCSQRCFSYNRCNCVTHPPHIYKEW